MTSPSDALRQHLSTLLNPPQLAAVCGDPGPLLVLAGAGSGKTRVLTYRYYYLVKALGFRPEQIFAVTFTNKAAGEMKNRAEQLLGDQFRRSWIGTFHAMCGRMLRLSADRIPPRYANERPLTSDYTIYDEDDAERVMKAVIEEMNLDVQLFNVRSARRIVSNAKNRRWTPDQLGGLVRGPALEIWQKVWTKYDMRLRGNNAMDFDDMLLYALNLLEVPEERERWQNRFSAVLVDEYQDTNYVQYMLARILAEKHGNIMVVGDDDQSIYSWRGARVDNIFDFERDFPQATVVRLEQNYRSTKRILEAANAVVHRNRKRKEKRLWTENPEGDAIKLIEAASDLEEASWVRQRIESLRAEKGIPYGQSAILYRTNAQSRVLEDALRNSGIPYVIIGGLRFYARREVKDVLAYLRILVNPRDDAAFRRASAYPKRGVGETSLKRLDDLAQSKGLGMLEYLLTESDWPVSGPAVKGLKSLVGLVRALQEQADGGDVAEVTRQVIDRSGILDALVDEDPVEGQERKANVEELYRTTQEFVTRYPDACHVSDYLAEVTLLSDLDTADTSADRVTLMTVHSAKGLEFDAVFIVGLEEGLFPLVRRQAERDEAEEEKALEEERRLFYVALTRARKFAHLLHATARNRWEGTMFTSLSRFAKEIPPLLLEKGFAGLSQGSMGSTFPPRGNARTGMDFSSRPSTPVRTASTAAPRKELGFRVGSIVQHSEFGRGVIVDISGDGPDTRIVVEFKRYGMKKLMARLAPIQITEY